MVAELPASRLYYNPTQAARRLDVCTKTIYRWIECGKLLPVLHLGRPRIPREQIINIQLGHQ